MVFCKTCKRDRLATGLVVDTKMLTLTCGHKVRFDMSMIKYKLESDKIIT